MFLAVNRQLFTLICRFSHTVRVVRMKFVTEKLSLAQRPFRRTLFSSPLIRSLHVLLYQHSV
jgi:hypothetical protein